MVEYKCKKCTAIFVRKGDYKRHMDRKTPCNIFKGMKKKPKIYQCRNCNYKFNRKDGYDTHMNKCKKISQIQNNAIGDDNAIGEIIVKGNSNNNNNNNNNNITNNKNIAITNNYYTITPFCQDGISNLSAQEKFNIFASKENPIITIIVKTNLNKDMPEHHNVGYTDLKSGYGYFFDGKRWQQKIIQQIMNELLESKQKDLIEMHDQIKKLLSDEINDDIKNKLDKIQDLVQPRLDIHVDDKNKLIKNMKTKFYNDRHLVLDAIKHTGNDLSNIENEEDYSYMLKEGYTIQDAEILIKKTELKKKIALELLNIYKSVEQKNFQSMKNMIDKTHDYEDLETIIRVLNKSIFLSDDIDIQTIQQKIDQEKIDKILLSGIMNPKMI